MGEQDVDSTNVRSLACLTSLNLSRTQVSDLGVESLVAGGSLRHSLKELRLDNCPRVTDDAVETVLESCVNLNILIFHGCPQTSDRSRQALQDFLMNNSGSMKQVTWTVY